MLSKGYDLPQTSLAPSPRALCCLCYGGGGAEGRGWGCICVWEEDHGLQARGENRQRCSRQQGQMFRARNRQNHQLTRARQVSERDNIAVAILGWALEVSDWSLQERGALWKAEGSGAPVGTGMTPLGWPHWSRDLREGTFLLWVSVHL